MKLLRELHSLNEKWAKKLRKERRRIKGRLVKQTGEHAGKPVAELKKRQPGLAARQSRFRAGRL